MNYFTHTVVQQRVRDFFIHGIENDRLAHAYIFYSPQGAGKEAFAFELAKALNCTSDTVRPCGECPSCRKIESLGHPDVKYIFPIKKDTPQKEIIRLIKGKAKNPYTAMDLQGHINIPIEMIRSLKEEAKYAPYEAKIRFFIINGAEHLAGPAANSFLKLLEEPPNNLIIILITHQLDSLLETIRSRCQPVYFPPFTADEIVKIVGKYEKIDETIENKIAFARNDIEKVFELLYSDSPIELELVYRYLSSLVKENFFEVSTTIDAMLNKRDKRHAVEILNHILLWFNDSFHYSITKDKKEIINKIYEENIIKFSDFYHNLDYEHIVNLIDQAQRDINGNGHPAMVFFNLAIKIRDELHKNKEEIV
jgi:DNA polymerase-3 subunit delta'